MQRNQAGQKQKHATTKKKAAGWGHGGEALPLCSFFAVVLVLVSLAVLVVLVAFVVFGVLVAPFVCAALVVCAAGAVFHVVVAELVIKQNNKEASRKRKSK